MPAARGYCLGVIALLACAMSAQPAAAGSPSLAPTIANPAMMIVALPGLTTEFNVTVSDRTSSVNPTGASNPFIPGLATFGGSGNMNHVRAIPAGAAVYRGPGDWAFGVTTHSPYSVDTQPNLPWAGMVYSSGRKISTQNFTPQAAYRVNERLSIGAGLQIQAMQADISQTLPVSPSFGDVNFKGDTVSYGYVVGATLAVTPRTLVGAAYRSKIDQKIDGTISRPAIPFFGLPAVALPASVTFPMPDRITLSAAHRFDATWTLFGQLEWENWSRFGTIPIDATPAGVPAVPTSLAVQFRDTWTTTAGVEYRWRPDLALRTVWRYRQAATTDGTRTPATSSADAIRGAIGFAYDITDRLTLDIAYLHTFARHVPINIGPGHPAYTPAQGTFTGDATYAADEISVGLRYYWGTKP